MQLPRGLESLPGDGNAVGAKVALPMLVVLWLGVVLLVGLGVLLLIAGQGGAIPVWAPLLLILFGLALAALAFVSGRRPKFVIDDEGVHSRAVVGRAQVRWEAMQEIALSQPRGNTIWFTAPGGILRRGKVTRTKRIPFQVAGLRVRSRDLHAYVVQRAQSRRA